MRNCRIYLFRLLDREAHVHNVDTLDECQHSLLNLEFNGYIKFSVQVDCFICSPYKFNGGTETHRVRFRIVYKQALSTGPDVDRTRCVRNFFIDDVNGLLQSIIIGFKLFFRICSRFRGHSAIRKPCSAMEAAFPVQPDPNPA